jgi:hypothetical protein
MCGARRQSSVESDVVIAVVIAIVIAVMIVVDKLLPLAAQHSVSSVALQGCTMLIVPTGIDSAS